MNKRTTIKKFRVYGRLSGETEKDWHYVRSSERGNYLHWQTHTIIEDVEKVEKFPCGLSCRSHVTHPCENCGHQW